MGMVFFNRAGQQSSGQTTSALGSAFSAKLVVCVDWLAQQRERYKSRRLLMAMNDDQLKDIGLSRGTAFSEASRRFWD